MQPLLECLLAGEEAEPGPLDVRDELALGGHVGQPVGQPQLRLQGVEVGLELGLLLDPGGLVLPAILAILLQLLLDGHQGVAGLGGDRISINIILTTSTTIIDIFIIFEDL